MPEFTLSLHVDWIKRQFFFRADEKAKLGRNAEVGNSQKGYLLENTVTAQLHINLLIAVQIVYCQRRDLHYVTNVEQVEPLALIEVSEQDFHV